MTRREPRPGANCVVCGHPIPKTASRYADPDAFCSARHCREYFGTQLEVDVPARTSKLAASRVGGFRSEVAA